MKLSLIVPVFNEEEAISIFYNAVRCCEKLDEFEVEIIFINDGSTDGSERVINELIELDDLVTLISFSRNFGKEPALFAGLDYATGNVSIPIDVDLQDPIEVIPLLIDQYKAGADVVLAKRVDRSTDGFLKRNTALLFYWLHNKIAATPIEPNVGDFRLISDQVVQAIKKLPERQLFMKGLLSWVGFNTAIVEYRRDPRVAGKTKFNGWKLWNLALEGFTSFSTIPLRIWSYFGGAIAFLGFIYAFIIIFKKLFFGNEVSGYASIMSAILLLGGIQLIGIGVIGEYLGRVYMETKARPRYIIKNVKRNSQETNIKKSSRGNSSRSNNGLDLDDSRQC